MMQSLLLIGTFYPKPAFFQIAIKKSIKITYSEPLLIEKITNKIHDGISKEINTIILLTGDKESNYNDWLLGSSLLEEVYDTQLSKEIGKSNTAHQDKDKISFGLQCMLQNSFGDLLSLDSHGQFAVSEKLYFGTKNEALKGFNKGLHNLKNLEQKWEVDDVQSIVNLIYIFETKNTRVSIIKLSNWENLSAEWEGIQQLLCLGEIVGEIKNSPTISNCPLIKYLSHEIPISNTEFICYAYQKPSNYDLTLTMLEDIHKTSLEVKSLKHLGKELVYLHEEPDSMPTHEDATDMQNHKLEDSNKKYSQYINQKRCLKNKEKLLQQIDERSNKFDSSSPKVIL